MLALTLAATLAWEVHALFFPVATTRAGGTQRYEIEEFAAGVPVGQTFRAVTDGLDTAIVTFTADRPASLVVRYRVMGWAPAKLDDHWAPVIESTEDVRLSPGTNRHPFHFKAIVDSARQVYQFQVQQVEVRALDGNPEGLPTIGVLASTDNALDDGNVIVGKDQIIDRDLLFEAKGADSRFDDFRMRINPQLPRALRHPAAHWALCLIVLGLYNWALAVFACQTVTSVAVGADLGRPQGGRRRASRFGEPRRNRVKAGASSAPTGEP